MGDREASRRGKKEEEEEEVEEQQQPQATGRWRSSCRRCGRKKRKPEQDASKTSKTLEERACAMARPASKCNPCSPLSYIINRQIDYKVNYCRKLVDARFLNSDNLFKKDLYAHYGCINAIEFSPEGDLLISGGDDKRVLLWKVEQAIQDHERPTVMKAQHMSNIFCLGYNCSKTKIFSAGNDDQVIVHDLESTDVLNFFRHEKPVYGLSVHPHNENVFASACDDGRILIYDIRGTANSPESFFCMAQYKSSFQSVMFNPVDPVTLVTANTKEGASLWDVRKPLTPIIRYGSNSNVQNCMSIRFDKMGKLLFALRRRLPPVLFATKSSEILCEFDHPGYYNSCTMKSCCFAGNDDEYVLSGSDDFQLYMWKIPDDDNVKVVDSAHMVLRGHRSIVNQVRYNQSSCLLASSGVEKVIKLWSPFPLSDNCLGGLKRDIDKKVTQRRVYTHEEYIALVLRSGQFMTHDYSHQSTEEDQRMMAFFDSLVQRDIESWSSEDLRTPQSPTDIEENNNSSELNNTSDSEDSTTASDRQIMRCYLNSTLNSGTPVPFSERPLDSPNRITRLIANKREKLLRQQQLGSTSKQHRNSTNNHRNNNYNTSAANAGESGSTSEPENASGSTRSKSKNKINLRSKTAKRKHSGRMSLRTRARRKQNNAKDDSDSEPEQQPACASKNNYQPVDTTQPSTSTGVISNRRVTATTLLRAKPRLRPMITSSSSSEDEGIAKAAGTDKRKPTKSDSDSSSKEVAQKRKVIGARNKSKAACGPASRRETRGKSKRQKVNHEAEAGAANRLQRDGTPVAQNGGYVETISTPPTRSSRRSVAASDSGLGVSTTEKSGASTAEKRTRFGRAESSDRERSAKTLELFNKRVDQARRGYRKRSLHTDSDSSDE